MVPEIESLIHNEYFLFVLIFGCALIIAQMVHHVLINYVRALTRQTETEIDDIILEILIRPVYVYIIVGGLYFAFQSLSLLDPYANYVDDIFFVGSVLLAALVVSQIARVLLEAGLKVQERFEKMPELMSYVITILVYILAFLVIMYYFDIKLTPLIAAYGLGGLAVALALQDTLSNIFSGLHIVSDQPINYGDFIEIEGGLSGFVEDISWRSTRLRTLPNTLVIIPNSKLASSIITNYSLPVLEMSVLVQCGVAYDSDLEEVERVTIEAGKEVQMAVPGAVTDFEPVVRYHTFGDSNIEFSIILRAKDPTSKYILTHEFIKALKKRYDEEEIEISWPVRKIYHGE
ncbi:Small-conductance mechanosensitive channel [Candidatus Methanophagaceae archaeon]|jgi:small-conductance mechanosensitive channel|nr:Small-conductance mechanosensitive channel [Methanophagales archaeon]